MDASRIEGVPLFAGLSRRERKQLARWADQVDVAEGTELATEGRFAHEFFVIEDGSAEVTRGDQKIKQLGPGDFFGEMALMDTDRRTATVTATSPMRLIVMFEREFRTMAHEMPEVAETLRSAIADRWQGAEGPA